MLNQTTIITAAAPTKVFTATLAAFIYALAQEKDQDRAVIMFHDWDRGYVGEDGIGYGSKKKWHILPIKLESYDLKEVLSFIELHDNAIHSVEITHN